MLCKVQEMRPGFNNDQAIARSRIFSTGKILCDSKILFHFLKIESFLKYLFIYFFNLKIDFYIYYI